MRRLLVALFFVLPLAACGGGTPLAVEGTWSVTFDWTSGSCSTTAGFVLPSKETITIAGAGASTDVYSATLGSINGSSECTMDACTVTASEASSSADPSFVISYNPLNDDMTGKIGGSVMLSGMASGASCTESGSLSGMKN